MALETTQKYLDWYGLGLFWNKLRQYISNQILDIDGKSIVLDNDTSDSPTVTSQINELWEAIGSTTGSGGSISENIQNILGAYIKSIEGTSASEQTYVGVGYGKDNITYDKSSGAVDIKLRLDESKLKQKFQQIDSIIYVNTIKASGTNGISVTGAENQSSGDIELVVNGGDLSNRISEIETSYVKKVSVADKKTGGNEYVTATVTPTEGTGEITITIDDSKVTQALDQTTDLSSQEFAVNGKNFYEDADHDVKIVSGDITHNSDDTGTGTSTIYQEIETLKTAASTLDTKITTETTNRTNADNALSQRISGIENSYVKSVATNDGTYVKLTPNSAAAGEVVVTVDDTAIGQAISEITSSYVKSFASKTGDITIDSDASTAGTVKFSMNDNELQGSVQGLGDAAYETLSTYTTAQIEAIFS